jgi:hypothetical protein
MKTDPTFDVQGSPPRAPRLNPLAVDTPDIVRFIESKRPRAISSWRERPSHAALHGIIRPVDDPFWDGAFPPCGFGCRCVAQQMSRSQAARLGGQTSAEKAEAAIETARHLSKGEGDFWGYNVGKLADEAAVAQVQRVNERRIEGSPPLSGLAIRGASAWLSLFADKIVGLIQGE